MAQNYRFDIRTFAFLKETGLNVWRIFRILLGYLLVSLSLTVLAYAVFALVFSTDVERRLRRENRSYEKIVPQMEERAALLTDEVACLQYKDNDIYEQVFHSNAPAVDPMSSLDNLFASENVPVMQIAAYSKTKSEALEAKSEKIESLFEDILCRVSDSSFVCPPMTLPLKDVTYPQTGASVGSRLNPFYKAQVEHDGIDFLVSRGTPVLCPADGVVSTPSPHIKSQGKVVQISHPGGYTTRYEHLDEVYVQPGQRVSKGKTIGTVGMSGSSYAPHLHYSVRRDSVVVDPVNLFFASLSPDEYANYLYMSVNTMQSMD